MTRRLVSTVVESVSGAICVREDADGPRLGKQRVSCRATYSDAVREFKREFVRERLIEMAGIERAWRERRRDVKEAARRAAVPY